jgi:hypothetical protein
MSKSAFGLLPSMNSKAQTSDFHSILERITFSRWEKAVLTRKYSILEGTDFMQAEVTSNALL